MNFNKFLFLVWVVFFIGCEKSSNENPSPAIPVKVIQASEESITIYKDFVGQVFGYNDIPIRTRVEGFLQKINAQDGSYVKQGDLLYTIDPEPLLEGVNAAKSDLARSKVGLDKALSDFNRIQPLAEISAVSQRDLDAALAAKNSAYAVVDAADANLRLAEIRLGYASIKAPVDGIIGKTLSGIGEFVGRSPSPVVLNTVSTIDSLRVEFFITENDYLAWANKKQTKNDSISIPLQLVLSNGSVFPYKGKINFINREVNNITGAILIQSIFPNPERIVKPGQFARVRAGVEKIPNALLVPQRCVTEIQGNYFVKRVNENNEIEEVSIKIGKSFQDYFIVLEGISPADKIVFEGLQKAKTGNKVVAELINFQSQFKGE